MADTQQIPTDKGDTVTLASPKALLIKNIPMPKEPVDFFWEYPSGLKMGPATFNGNGTTWRLLGPLSAPSKTLGPVPVGMQRYILADAANKVARSFEFSENWIRISAISTSGKVVL